MNFKKIKKQVFEKFQFLQSWCFLKNGWKFWKNFFAILLFMVKDVLCQKFIKIDLTILEIKPQFPQKPGFSLFLHFRHFWHTIMTKKCFEGLDLNFFMYWSTKKISSNFGAPLVQKCSALPEYSQKVVLIIYVWTCI